MENKIKLSIYLITGAMLFNCTAQKNDIIIGQNISIVSSNNSIPYTEPYIVVNPTDKNNLAVGAIKVLPTGWESVAIMSEDDGKTWDEINLALPDSVSRSGDPYLQFDDKGTLYYTMLGDNSIGMGQLLFRSNDKGRTWSEGVWVNSNKKWLVDHSTIKIDNNNESSFYGNIYAASHVNYRDKDRNLLFAPFISISRDQGKSFYYENIYEPSLKNMNNGEAVITSDGTIYFIYFVFMDDNGNWLDKHQLRIISSNDGGKTFTKSKLISDNFTAYYPTLAIDESDKFKDRIYTSWTYTKSPNQGIYIAYKDTSDDEWSDPIKVTDSLSNTPLISSISVNSKGVVGVSWFDNRNDNTKTCYDMYFSYSSDGGNSFSKDFRVTDQSSCPTSEQSGEAFARWRRGGDYHGLTTSGETFHIVWPDARNGLFKPYYTRIDVNE